MSMTEELKRILSKLNVYGETSKQMDAPPKVIPPLGSPEVFTSNAEQDRMRADLEAAREKERKKKAIPANKAFGSVVPNKSSK